MEDIYHYIPIAAKLGRTDKACGADHQSPGYDFPMIQPLKGSSAATCPAL